MANCKNLILAIFLAMSCVSEAKDLGVFGETFEIQEPNLIAEIFCKLKALSDSGDIAKQNEIVKSRVKERVLAPKRLQHITKATKSREYKFDPTITLNRDLKDHRGQVFAKKGDSFNPLTRISYTKSMIFIDGEDEKQVQWMLSQANTLIVLTAGAPLDLEKKIERVVYFDQHGLITKRLGIEHVPAIVSQKEGETVLTIKEEAIE